MNSWFLILKLIEAFNYTIPDKNALQFLEILLYYR